MAYPAKINALVDIAGTSTLAAVGHAARHNDLNDAFDELAVVLTVPAANTLALAPGGTERLRIDSAGNVGIGTSTPAKLLDVNGDALVSGLTVGKGAGAVSTNTAVGGSALNANTSGGYNTAIGKDALLLNTTGGGCTALGITALRANTTGLDNTALGTQALLSNTTGYQNTAAGQNALNANTTGYQNTAVGREALVQNTTGIQQVAIGQSALVANTTGTQNTALGQNALSSNTTGDSNVSVGMNSLVYNVSGSNNVVVGRDAMFDNTASSNTAIGYDAGRTNTTGTNNTFIGNGTRGATITTSDAITLGNSSIATLRCQVTTITALSDARDKTNIEPIPAGLDFVNRLSPVAFDWDTRDGAKVGIADMGFIAQDLLKVMEDTGIKVPNLVSQENPDRLEAGYGTLIPVLVQAIKELSAQVRQLQEAANV